METKEQKFTMIDDLSDADQLASDRKEFPNLKFKKVATCIVGNYISVKITGTKEDFRPYFAAQDDDPEEIDHALSLLTPV